MSINDPILEALSFALENDLRTCSEAPEEASGTSDKTRRAKPSSSKQAASEELEGGGNTKKGDPDNVAKGEFVKSAVLLEEEEPTPCPAPNCLYFADDNVTSDKVAQKKLLSHLLLEHQLVIDNCEEIANLPKYFKHWKGKFAKDGVESYCVGIKMAEPPKPPEVGRRKRAGSGEEGEPGEEPKGTEETSGKLYYMLSPALPEDSRLRKALWQERLDKVLEVNRQERIDTKFCRRCLFCREIVSGNRTHYFEHMRDSHSFHIGLPDNLVFVNELLQFIEDKLNRLECLSCEHIFKDKAVLKEHMRKKQHRKLNPKNQEYDRFYVVNYLEPGKTWETLQFEEPEDERKEDEWLEAPEKLKNIVCLFCKTSDSEFQGILDHMKSEHFFDFEAISSSFDFYQKIKLINYIRRAMYQNMCLSCEERFPEPQTLLNHISEHKINSQSELLPKTEEWNQPEYFFPTYEEDDFLTCLDNDDIESDVDSQDGSCVIPEDMPHIDVSNRDFDLAGFAIKFHNQDRS